VRVAGATAAVEMAEVATAAVEMAEAATAGEETAEVMQSQTSHLLPGCECGMRSATYRQPLHLKGLHHRRSRCPGSVSRW